MFYVGWNLFELIRIRSGYHCENKQEKNGEVNKMAFLVWDMLGLKLNFVLIIGLAMNRYSREIRILFQCRNGYRTTQSHQKPLDSP